MRAFMALAVSLLAAGHGTPQPSVTITVVNPLDVARPAETISVVAADLIAAVGAKDVRGIHVRDSRSGTDLLTQAIDLDDNGTFDELIFQADLAPNETR